MATIVYRHAQWDSPWWVSPNRSAGRYNRASDQVTQYWCVHPLGPAAELLRWSGRALADDLDTVRLRLWAARLDTAALPSVTFDNAGSFGVSAEQLVSDDFRPTQDLAERLRREGHEGFSAPSAALPGTEVVVLFGPRLLAPYLLEPVDPEQQVPTAHVAESLVATEVVPAVRWRGSKHAALEEWRRTGTYSAWQDPPVPR